MKFSTSFGAVTLILTSMLILEPQAQAEQDAHYHDFAYFPTAESLAQSSDQYQQAFNEQKKITNRAYMSVLRAMGLSAKKLETLYHSRSYTNNLLAVQADLVATEFSHFSSQNKALIEAFEKRSKAIARNPNNSLNYSEVIELVNEVRLQVFENVLESLRDASLRFVPASLPDTLNSLKRNFYINPLLILEKIQKIAYREKTIRGHGYSPKFTSHYHDLRDAFSGYDPVNLKDLLHFLVLEPEAALRSLAQSNPARLRSFRDRGVLPSYLRVPPIRADELMSMEEAKIAFCSQALSRVNKSK
jgi:hypothetical protein